jgi:hypothetical protein
LRAGGGELGEPLLRLRVGDLDLQAVELLAQRVNLIGKLPRLCDERAERRLRQGRLSIASAWLEQQGNRDRGRRQRRNPPYRAHIDARYRIAKPLPSDSLEVLSFYRPRCSAFTDSQDVVWQRAVDAGS